MNKRTILIAAGALLLLSGKPRLFAADTNASGEAKSVATNAAVSSSEQDLSALITRINAKLTGDQVGQPELAEDIKEFDVLLAKHQDAKPEDRAHILAMKGQLYLQVLKDPEKALEAFKQVKAQFSTLQINGNTDEVINSLQVMVEKKKIHDALAPGTAFPDFEEKDVEGKALSIGRYKGKVVLVDFWATWCVPCVVDLPEVLKVYEKFHDKGFEIVGVSLDEDKGKLEQFVKQRKMPWPQFFDGKRWENKLATKYGVESTPSGYLIDREGKIIMALSHADGLEAAVAKALER